MNKLLCCSQFFSKFTPRRSAAPSSRSSRASRPGRREQLTPMTSAPARSSSGANVSGGVPSRRVAVLLGRHLRDDRQRRHDCARRESRRAISFRSRNVSSMNRSTPPSTSAVGLLAERVLGLVDAGPAPRLDAHAERTDRSGDPRRVARGVPRDRARPATVDRADLVGQAEVGELEAIGAERVGLDARRRRRARTRGALRRPDRAA